jgi:hypothetical protein
MKSKAMEEAILASLNPQTPRDIRRGVQLIRTSGNIPVVRLHYSAKADRDPERNPEWLQKERRKYTSQAAWDREQEIIDEAGGGELVFADTLVTWWKKIVITDPRWRPDPDWRVEGGFDHGKTNATAMLRTYHDFDGTIYFAGEYYQPGKEIWQHAPALRKMVDFDRMETRYADPTIFDVTSQQSHRPGQAAERAKSFGELYAEQGVELAPFHGDRSDVSFAGRLMLHWADLEHREPTVKILCPEGVYSDTPQFGLHQWACPNLLWELMRTRRQKLSAAASQPQRLRGDCRQGQPRPRCDEVHSYVASRSEPQVLRAASERTPGRDAEDRPDDGGGELPENCPGGAGRGRRRAELLRKKCAAPVPSDVSPPPDFSPPRT